MSYQPQPWDLHFHFARQMETELIEARELLSWVSDLNVEVAAKAATPPEINPYVRAWSEPEAEAIAAVAAAMKAYCEAKETALQNMLEVAPWAR